MSAARFIRSIDICVKFTQIKDDHLICLSQQEALMLFGIMQAAVLHEPMQACLLGRHEYSAFYRTMTTALARAAAATELEAKSLLD